jgi:hypothetical protein
VTLMNKLKTTSVHAPDATQAAIGLGWFSLALGAVEVLMPRQVARAAGVDGMAHAVRAYGVREIVTGVGLLVARRKAPWMWARVAGDALDLATLGLGARANGLPAVAAADVACARALSQADVAAAHEPPRDYSDRSGLPQPPAQMRGAARADFETPQDMQLPSALRPYTLH